MLIILMLVKLLYVATIATNIKIHFRRTHGEKIPGTDVIKHLIKDGLDSETVGVRISSTDEEVREPLPHTWIEQRHYVADFCYYEKFVVDEEFTDPGTMKVIIPGPLSEGTKILITSSASTPFSWYTINIIEQKYLTSTWPPFDVLLHVELNNGGQIVFNNMKYGNWQSEILRQTSESNLHGQLTTTIDIQLNNFHVSLLDDISASILQETPGDTSTFILLQTDEGDQPALNRLVYKRGV